MNLNIQGRHLPITPALNRYVKTKIQKIKYYFEYIIHAHVVLQTNKEQFIAEGTLTVEHHHFHNKVSTDDMYKSIDFLFDKLERQVRRYKEALRDRKRRTQSRQMNALSSHSLEIADLQEANKIFIDDIAVEAKPMSNLEAVLQLHSDEKMRIKGFLNVDKNEHISFLIKEVEDNQFSLIAYDDVWEFETLELVKKENREEDIVVHHVETIKPSSETIEDAIDFLLHNDSRYRFFTSLRTDREMLIYEINQHHFSLLREE